MWLLLDASGGIHNFEKFMGDILSAKDYHFVAPQILLGSVLVGLVLVALMTILTVIAAALYNVFVRPRRWRRGHARRDRLSRSAFGGRHPARPAANLDRFAGL